jgi:hypothetical protein
MYDSGTEAARAPLYGIGGLLGITLMALLFAAFPAVRWFALLSLPLGIIMAIGMRLWRYLIYERTCQIIWTRNVRHFRWPQPIS